MKDLTIVVLTHNRSDLIEETVESILHQSCSDFKFVVSDNSSNDDTKVIFQKSSYSKINYIKRNTVLSPFDHFNTVISEIDTRYFVLFHDDDLMLPDYVETMYNAVNNTSYAAVGCNAYLYSANSAKQKIFMKLNSNVVLNNKNDIIEYYIGNKRFAPFPSYIYSKKEISNLRFTDKVGKYSDVAWLIDILNIGKIYWLSIPLMKYRIHSNQDSASFDYYKQIKLSDLFIKECSKNITILKKIRKYKIMNLYGHMLSIFKNTGKMSSRYLAGILCKNSLCVYYFRYVIKVIIKGKLLKNSKTTAKGEIE